MARLFLVTLFCLVSGMSALANEPGEYIVVTGGVSLWEWEKYKLEPHDHWWLNFIRASRIKIGQLRQQYGPNAQITWMVYRPAYQRRQVQEKENLFSVIDSVRDAFHTKLIYFDNADQLCYYLNYGDNRAQNKIASFDYFGHSNRACFMFDYSNQIGSASKAWLHDSELKSKLQHGIFTRDAHVQSWGCYQGEELARYWKQATGAKMIAAFGKTQYMTDTLPVLSTPGGHWGNGG